jgi:alpha-tubulin suppressor-like RCC1 family protein
VHHTAAAVARLAVLPLLLFACVPVATETAKATPDACLLSASSASPGASLQLSGVPLTVADTSLSGYVEVTGDATSRRPLTVVRAAGQSAITITAPLHPVAPLSGGTVSLVVGGRELSATTSTASSLYACAPMSLTVKALPSAPGTAQAVYSQLSRALTPLVTASGASATELIASRTTGPTHLQALGAALWLLDGADNVNSLRKVLDGTAAIYNGQVVDPKLLDGVLASGAVLTDLQKLGDVMAGAGPPPASAVAAPSRADDRARSTSPSALPTIATAAQLDYWMRVQQRIEANQALAESLLDGLNIVVAMSAAMAPPVVAPIATAIGLVSYIQGLILDAMKQSLPTELSTMEADVTPVTFAEDATTVGHWSNVRILARSGRWSISLPRIIDGVLVGVGGGITKRFEQVLSKMYFNARGDRWILMTSSVKAIGECLNQVTALLVKALGGTVDAGVWAAGPFTYGPIDVTSPTYSTAFTSSNGVIALTDIAHEFRAQAAGTTNLVVRTKPEVFAGKQTDKTTSITVRGLAVSVAATSVEVRPGNEQLILVQVTDATDPRVTWKSSGGSIVPDGGAFARWTAPQTLGTYTVTACHITRTTRCGSASIVVSNKISVTVSPTTATVITGARQTFIATVDGSTNQSVTWAAQRGTITTGGVYTAPATEGSDIVTARSVVDNTALASAQVTVTKQAIIADQQTIAVGDVNSCAISTTGNAYCWGQGLLGVLGNGTTVNYQLTPVAVSSSQQFVSIGVGSTHACALTTAGAVYCWGFNSYGQLGTGTTSNVPLPVPQLVTGGQRFVALSVSREEATCALTADGVLYCWGKAASGIFGTATAPAVSGCVAAYCSVPVVVPAAAALRFAKLGQGGSNAPPCAITTTGQTYCWGGGIRGDGTAYATLAPFVAVTGAASTAMVSSGNQTSFSCAVSIAGSLTCWGQGVLGRGTYADLALTPVVIGTNFSAVAVGSGTACGLKAGSLFCWGGNGWGATGLPLNGCVGITDFGAQCVLAPTPVTGAPTLSIVTMAQAHGCGITPAGDAYCWGFEGVGTLGTGARNTVYLPPQKVVTGVRFKVPTP